MPLFDFFWKQCGVQRVTEGILDVFRHRVEVAPGGADPLQWLARSTDPNGL